MSKYLKVSGIPCKLGVLNGGGDGSGVDDEDSGDGSRINYCLH